MSIEAMKMALKFMHSVQFSVEEYIATEAALVAAIEQAEKQDGECKRCDGKGCVACDARRVCSGCDKTNTDDSMWAVYCVECWSKTEENKPMTKEEWVGLTEIEICDIEADELTSASSETFSFARAIEAKLKELNT